MRLITFALGAALALLSAPSLRGATLETPERVVLADVAALSAGDLEAFLALYDPEAKIFGLPKDPHALVGSVIESMLGPERLRSAFAKSLAKPPFAKLEIEGSVALGELVAARVKITDPPPTGRVEYVLAVYRVRDGRIRDLWHVAREAADAPPRVGATPERVLRDLMDAGNSLDLEGWLGLFSADAKQWKRAVDTDQLANVLQTKASDQASRRAAYTRAFAATPHGRAVIEDTVTVGDYIASRGSFNFPDLINHTLTIYRVHAGLLQDIWDVEQVKEPVAGAQPATPK